MPRTVLFLVLLIASAPVVAQAQDTPLVADAIAARDSGNLAGAAAMLRQVLDREPANGEATRYLAQVLYWLKDIPGATALYERGMRQHPGDFSLQLDYGRMLVETRAGGRAIEVLAPLETRVETAAQASTLLGTLHYWRGDLTAASRFFRSAIAADSSLLAARTQLDEIRALSAPWVAFNATGFKDDQPVERISGEFEAGLFLNPATSVTARFGTMRFGYDDALFACPGASGSQTDKTCHTTLGIGEVALSHYLPAPRLNTRIGAGIVGRSFGEPANDWIGHAVVRLALRSVFDVEARGERAPYFATETSLIAPLMTNGGSLRLLFDNPAGWLGEAAYRIDNFPDENSVTSIYAWSLAPLIRRSGVTFRAGYSIASQDAAESRFAGRYYPYYTPENILTHSGLAHLSIVARPGTTITARGGYGFLAREDAPTLLPGLGGGTLRFDRREFNPWDAHVTLNTALSNSFALSASVDGMKTAFYRATTAGVRVTYRFLPSAAR